MRLLHDSFLRKFLGVLRFILAKIFHFKSFKSKGLSLLKASCEFAIEGNGSIEIGRKMIVGSHACLYAKNGKIKLGNNVHINEFSRIVSLDEISIGDNVKIAKFVSILDHDYDYLFRSEKLELNGFKTRKVIIGSNVWIADKVTILKGTTIGDNVIIGTGAVINKNVPSNCIVVGNPQKIVKTFVQD